ncbi:hypothetical protein [Hymenobacter fodinae]|uniref:Uncharacterized protein n=1 Tax=Hymenobacter fodinae TaxID=2510796 RepID=A0A4Z0P201_9BACT|nr:hypothetical protein [Hymenobacter fodinae]TGE05452.1 hypothetical protein EU556_19305 [Hymenobacter fodinae]
MPKIDWDNLLLLSEWADALMQLLAAAEDAIKSKNATQRQQANDMLKLYIKKSPIDAGPLDTIAAAAIIDVDIAVIEEALFRIGQRKDELQKQIQLIQGVTKQASSSAKELRLDGLKKAVDSTKTALEGLKAVNDDLSKSDSKLTKKLDKIVADLNSLEEE